MRRAVLFVILVAFSIWSSQVPIFAKTADAQQGGGDKGGGDKGGDKGGGDKGGGDKGVATGRR